MSGETVLAGRNAARTYDQVEVIEKLLEAYGCDDDEAIRVWTRRLEPPADALVAAKRSRGADFIREMGYITRLAEKKYGKDWLEKSDGELMAMSIRLGSGD